MKVKMVNYSALCGISTFTWSKVSVSWAHRVNQLHTRCASSCKKDMLKDSTRPAVLQRRISSQCVLQGHVEHCQLNALQHRHLSTRKQAKDLLLNPVDELQPYVSIPIIPRDSFIFAPSDSDVQKAKELFRSSSQHTIKLIKRAVDVEKLPVYDIPEVAFVGRSNVGKTSLIKALFAGAPEIHHPLSVSKKAGHTRTLRLYQAGKAFTLVDMPGYGFNMPDHFEKSVEGYLKTRKNMKMLFLLIDGEVGFRSRDDVMLQRIILYKCPFCLVMTKIDKAGRHRLLKNLMSLLDHRDKDMLYCTPQPFLVSSTTGAGISLLQAYIAYLTANLGIHKTDVQDQA